MQRLRAIHAAGDLDAVQERTLFAGRREPEELYDLRADPWELNNLASDPAHAEQLNEMRDRLARWEQETDDHGRELESEAMYDSDMAAYLGAPSEERPKLKANIELMKHWRAEGK